MHNELAAGIEHVLGLSLIHYTMCTVAKPAGKGCLVTNELVQVHLHGLGISGPLVKFQQESGKLLGGITIDNCSAPFLNGPFPLEGSLSANPHNENSTLGLTSGSGSELLFAGNVATFVAEYQAEMQGGGLLEFR